MIAGGRACGVCGVPRREHESYDACEMWQPPVPSDGVAVASVIVLGLVALAVAVGLAWAYTQIT